MQQNGRYREFTAASVLGGVLVGAILNVGIVFAGMQIGFTIVGSTVGAILGFGLLRGILRKGSILEVNVFQTVASSVNTVNAGVIFTVPVLFLLGLQDEIDYTSLVLATMAGSILGVVMIIPMRKQIIDFERLRFPSAVAVAAILKSPGAGVQKARLLVLGVATAAVIKVLVTDWTGSGDPLLPEYINIGKLLGLPSGFRMMFAVSLLSLGAGYLAGRPGLAILYGTLLNFWVLIPICIGLGWIPPGFDDVAVFAGSEAAHGRADAFAGAFRNFTANKVGIGMILGGAIAGIVIALPALRAVVASLRAPRGGERQEEVSLNVILSGGATGMLLLFVATKLSAGDHISWLTALLVAIVGGLWLWLAGLVVAQTTGRTDWSPLSGLALIAIAILMGVMGTGREFIVPAVTVGAAICVATSMCADMMADLKTGYLVGGRPLKQQLAQITTCWIGPGIALGTTILLWEAFAFGPDQPRVLYERYTSSVAEAEAEVELGGEGMEAAVARLEAAKQRLTDYESIGGSAENLPKGTPELGAPQAGALKAAIEIVQSGDIPLGKYLTGAVLGFFVSLLVSPGLGVMIGLSMYLPFMYMAVFGIGGLTNIWCTRRFGARLAEDKGVPIAAGLIVGDALVGVVHAVINVAGSVGG